MKLPASLRWIGLALLGLLIATVVALAATSLISRQIGIDSESITAGDKLAPAFGTAGSQRGQGTGAAAQPDQQGTHSTPGEAGPGPSVEPAEPESEDGAGEGLDD